jgi:hypothetical protein
MRVYPLMNADIGAVDAGGLNLRQGLARSWSGVVVAAESDDHTSL